MGSVTLDMTLIETYPGRGRRTWFRWRNRFLPPLAQLILGMLPPEWDER